MGEATSWKDASSPFTKPWIHTALLDWPRRVIARDNNFIGAPLPFEGLLKWGGILELFSKCYLDPWGLGGMISLLPSPTTPGPSGPPPQPWGPLAIFSALSLDRGPQVQICLSLSR